MVFEASHRNGIRAAVKILRPELASDADQVARFLREGAIANHLEHVGVVAALDDDRTEDGLFYVVFELLDVLGAAHDKGGLHRDVKPANGMGLLVLAALAGLAWIARTRRAQ